MGILRIAGKACFALVLAFTLWVCVSVCEIWAKNLDETPRYSEYNFFIVMCKAGNKPRFCYG